jgi:hypothetical protein
MNVFNAAGGGGGGPTGARNDTTTNKGTTRKRDDDINGGSLPTIHAATTPPTNPNTDPPPPPPHGLVRPPSKRNKTVTDMVGAPNSKTTGGTTPKHNNEQIGGSTTTPTTTTTTATDANTMYVGRHFFHRFTGVGMWKGDIIQCNRDGTYTVNWYVKTKNNTYTFEYGQQVPRHTIEKYCQPTQQRRNLVENVVVGTSTTLEEIGIDGGDSDDSDSDEDMPIASLLQKRKREATVARKEETKLKLAKAAKKAEAAAVAAKVAQKKKQLKKAAARKAAAAARKAAVARKKKKTMNKRINALKAAGAPKKQIKTKKPLRNKKVEDQMKVQRQQIIALQAQVEHIQSSTKITHAGLRKVISITTATSKKSTAVLHGVQKLYEVVKASEEEKRELQRLAAMEDESVDGGFCVDCVDCVDCVGIGSGGGVRVCTCVRVCSCVLVWLVWLVWLLSLLSMLCAVYCLCNGMSNGRIVAGRFASQATIRSRVVWHCILILPSFSPMHNHELRLRNDIDNDGHITMTCRWTLSLVQAMPLCSIQCPNAILDVVQV